MIGTSFVTLGWQSIAYQLPFKYYFPVQFFFTHTVVRDYTFDMCNMETGPMASEIASSYIKQLWSIINNFAYNSIKVNLILTFNYNKSWLIFSFKLIDMEYKYLWYGWWWHV